MVILELNKKNQKRSIALNLKEQNLKKENKKQKTEQNFHAYPLD